jgi:hypothetical protein
MKWRKTRLRCERSERQIFVQPVRRECHDRPHLFERHDLQFMENPIPNPDISCDISCNGPLPA